MTNNKQGAHVAVISRDGRVLLMERNQPNINNGFEGSNSIGLFGGLLDERENSLQAIRRELCKEELPLSFAERAGRYKEAILELHAFILDGVSHLVNKGTDTRRPESPVDYKGYSIIRGWHLIEFF
jgi:8-oxo-dGTP pyrophosphatase MutT (NUDIX family)